MKIYLAILIFYIHSIFSVGVERVVGNKFYSLEDVSKLNCGCNIGGKLTTNYFKITDYLHEFSILKFLFEYWSHIQIQQITNKFPNILKDQTYKELENIIVTIEEITKNKINNQQFNPKDKINLPDLQAQIKNTLDIITADYNIKEDGNLSQFQKLKQKTFYKIHQKYIEIYNKCVKDKPNKQTIQSCVQQLKIKKPIVENYIYELNFNGRKYYLEIIITYLPSNGYYKFKMQAYLKKKLKDKISNQVFNKNNMNHNVYLLSQIFQQYNDSTHENIKTCRFTLEITRKYLQIIQSEIEQSFIIVELCPKKLLKLPTIQPPELRKKPNEPDVPEEPNKPDFPVIRYEESISIEKIEIKYLIEEPIPSEEEDWELIYNCENFIIAINEGLFKGDLSLKVMFYKDKFYIDCNGMKGTIFYKEQLIGIFTLIDKGQYYYSYFEKSNGNLTSGYEKHKKLNLNLETPKDKSEYKLFWYDHNYANLMHIVIDSLDQQDRMVYISVDKISTYISRLGVVKELMIFPNENRIIKELTNNDKVYIVEMQIKDIPFTYIRMKIFQNDINIRVMLDTLMKSLTIVNSKQVQIDLSNNKLLEKITDKSEISLQELDNKINFSLTFYDSIKKFFQLNQKLDDNQIMKNFLQDLIFEVEKIPSENDSDTTQENDESFEEQAAPSVNQDEDLQEEIKLSEYKYNVGGEFDNFLNYSEFLNVPFLIALFLNIVQQNYDRLSQNDFKEEIHSFFEGKEQEKFEEQGENPYNLISYKDWYYSLNGENDNLGKIEGAFTKEFTDLSKISFSDVQSKTNSEITRQDTFRYDFYKMMSLYEQGSFSYHGLFGNSQVSQKLIIQAYYYDIDIFKAIHFIAYFHQMRFEQIITISSFTQLLTDFRKMIFEIDQYMLTNKISFYQTYGEHLQYNKDIIRKTIDHIFLDNTFKFQNDKNVCYLEKKANHDDFRGIDIYYYLTEQTSKQEIIKCDNEKEDLLIKVEEMKDDYEVKIQDSEFNVQDENISSSYTSSLRFKKQLGYLNIKSVQHWVINQLVHKFDKKIANPNELRKFQTNEMEVFSASMKKSGKNEESNEDQQVENIMNNFQQQMKNLVGTKME